MRWIRCQYDDEIFFGIVHRNNVELVQGTPFSSYNRTGQILEMENVRLLPPVAPRTMYATKLNYYGHAEEINNQEDVSVEIPTRPEVEYRSVGSLIAHEQTILAPSDAADQLQYEAELVVVIGRKTKRVSRGEAASNILGYTIGNDVTQRRWLAEDKSLWRAKNADTFSPMGPWIETDLNLKGKYTSVRLNHHLVSRFQTDAMVFDALEYISTISRYCTLYPGDVIWMGTNGPIHDLESGDIIEIEIDGIGVLSNNVVLDE